MKSKVEGLNDKEIYSLTVSNDGIIGKRNYDGMVKDKVLYATDSSIVTKNNGQLNVSDGFIAYDLKGKYAEKYKVEIELLQPRIAFKETINKKADTEYKYKKQSGGHGQYGHVKIIMEPSGDMETAYQFEQTVVGGAVPKNYFPAVEKGIAEAVKAGPLAGYPVTGVKVNLYDGSYHAVDSSELAFKVATEQAFKKGFMEASPVLLEPIATLHVIVPDDFTGAVMGDLNKRRARIMGMDPVDGGFQDICADIPYLELYEYDTSLYSMTRGSGTFSYDFARYEQAPHEVAQKEIEKAAKES